MKSKKNVGEEDYVFFDQSVNDKITEKIINQEPKVRIKLRGLLYHHEQKQKLDKELHNELVKLKRNYEKKTYDIIKQVNQVIKEEGTIVLNDFSEISLNMVSGDTSLFEPLPYEKTQAYWQTCIKNCSLLMYIYQAKDGEIAKCIETIDISREETKTTKAFTLSFQLSEDQKFFTNPFVQVTFYLIDSVNPFRQESNAEFKTKTNNKETTNNGIFLQLFQNINLEDGLNKISEAQDLCEKLGRSYEIALIFKDELIPYSFEYYLNARNPQLKKEIMEKQILEQLNEKKKPRQRQVYQLEDGDDDLADEQFLEDNHCKQQ